MPRSEKTIHYIYKTTCLVNNRYYIGMHSTSNIEDGYMGSGRRLRISIRKYGGDNHKKEILEFHSNRDELAEAEKIIVNKELLSDVLCMNLMCGGKGGFISEEQQRHRSQCAGKKFSQIRKENPEIDQQYREKMRIITSNGFLMGTRPKKWGMDWNGAKHTNETIQKMKEVKKGWGIGETNSQYGTCWITKNNENKKIKKDEIESYLLLGWVKGRKLK